jgi:hypothetical protein
VPVILTFVYGGGHSVVLYGYDKAHGKYLANYG